MCALVNLENVCYGLEISADERVCASFSFLLVSLPHLHVMYKHIVDILNEADKLCLCVSIQVSLHSVFTLVWMTHEHTVKW